jgi:hypothetical protein
MIEIAINEYCSKARLNNNNEMNESFNKFVVGIFPNEVYRSF